MPVDLAKVEQQLNLVLPTKIDSFDFKFEGLSLSIDAKREDLIHPVISGNKWRKLKYSIEPILHGTYNGILTFGGAYSNHLYAINSVCESLKIPLIALIRGDGYDPNNATLESLANAGASMYYVSRSEYRDKENGVIAKQIISSHPAYLVVPEGGSTQMAQKGIYEMCNEINFSNYDQIWVSAGTGATAGGLLSYIIDNAIDTQLHVVSSLKGDFMEREVLQFAGLSESKNLKVYNDYHWGGYAKMPEGLKLFQEHIHTDMNLPLDLVYNAKTLYALLDQFKSKVIHPSTRTLFINTGGRR